MTLNEFFAAHELNRVEIGYSVTRGTYTAIRNSSARLIKDSIFGDGNTPEAALSDLMSKVNGAARPQPAPVATKQEPVPDDLDDLLG